MIELHYRQLQDDGADPLPWISAGAIAMGVPFAITDLVEGATYETRCRQIYDDGSFSDWITAPATQATRASQSGSDDQEVQPTPPQNLRIDRDGCLAWDYPEGSAGTGTTFEVRTAPDATTSWNQARPIADTAFTAPPVSLCGVPRGETRTLLVAAVAPSGVLSDPVALTVNRGPFDEGKDVQVASAAEDPSFSGTKTNCTVVASVLTMSAGSMFYAPKGAKFYAPSGHAFYGSAKKDARYQWQVTVAAAPPSEDGRILTLAPVVTAPGWFVEYRPHAAMGKFYNTVGTPFYGPAWGPFYNTGGSWIRWPGSIPVRGTGSYDFRLTMPGTAQAASTATNLAARITRPSCPGAGSRVVVAPSVTATNFPLGTTEVPGTYRIKTNLATALELRVTARVTSGATIGKLWLQYSTDDATWSTLSGNFVDLSGAGTEAAAWEAVPAGAKGDVYVRAVTSAGDAAHSATFSNVELQVR